MLKLVIEPKEEGKGRSFTAHLLAYVRADYLWPGGQAGTNNQRPVFAMIAGSDQELRAFMANLTTGRKAQSFDEYGHRKDRFEFLKTAGYRVVWQKEEEGSIATIFLPDLFRIDPGMVDPEGAKFVVLPTQEWVQAQNIDPGPSVEHIRNLGYAKNVSKETLEQMVPLSYLFAAYLDRRTRCPLISDGRFFMQVMIAAIEKRVASYGDYHAGFSSRGYHAYETDIKDVGFAHGVAFSADHIQIESLLAEEVSRFMEWHA